MDKCIFCKISTKAIPAKIIFEDDNLLAFHDIHPKADIHFLIIPKIHIESMIFLEDQHYKLFGEMGLRASKLTKKLGLDGYKIQINTGVKGGQEVFHLHMHVLGNKS